MIQLNTLTRSFSIVAASVLLLTGCLGDSDGGSATPSSSSSSSTTTTLSGIAMAGAINGTVCAYSLSDTGTIGSTALACGATTPATGAYSLSWSNYVGSVILKAFGSYIDEATGLTKTILEANAMRSTVACTGSACQAAVTPLTEAAVRSASSLALADLTAAYARVAQAFGLNAAQLVTLLPTTSGSDSAALNYARVLALVSQAQSLYCGTNCSQETYLAALQTLLGGSSGVSNIQTAMNAAINAWNTNPLNTSGITCSYGSNAVLTCTLPSSSGNSGNNGSSGNYKLTVTVLVMGNTTTAAVINNIAKPSTEGEFCNSSQITEQINSALSAYPGATWTLNSCSFSGNGGTINATINMTSPVTMSVPYVVTYAYSAM